MWARREIPVKMDIKASTSFSIRRRTSGCSYLVWDTAELVPEWVRMEFIKKDAWKCNYSDPLPFKTKKSGINNENLQSIITHGINLPNLTEDTEPIAGSTPREMVQTFLRDNPSSDANIACIIMRDNEKNRRQIREIPQGRIISNDGNYYVTATTQCGETKSIKTGAWLTRYDIMPEDGIVILIGKRIKDEPIITIQFTEMMISLSAEQSRDSEYAAMCILSERYDIPRENFRHEPNGYTEFPDWIMTKNGQSWNVEVTRAMKQTNKILQIDKPDWTMQIPTVRRARPSQSHVAEVLQHKAESAGNSNLPTCLVIFRDNAEVPYREVDTSQIQTIIEVDEQTHTQRAIKERHP